MRVGSTRIVLFLFTVVIKIPVFWKGTKILIKGWTGNIDERELTKELKGTYKYEKIAPTYYSLFFGLINIAQKASPLRMEGTREEIGKILLYYFNDIPVEIDICSGIANFGMVGPKMVMVDYAVNRESTSVCDDCYCKNINI